MCGVYIYFSNNKILLISNDPLKDKDKKTKLCPGLAGYEPFAVLLYSDMYTIYCYIFLVSVCKLIACDLNCPI
jgi:hypothetical protein